MKPPTRNQPAQLPIRRSLASTPKPQTKKQYREAYDKAVAICDVLKAADGEMF